MNGDSLDEVAEFHLQGSADSRLYLYYMRYGANSFAENVKLLEESFEEKGSRRVRQLAYEVDGGEALIQFFEGKRDDGVPIMFVLMYRPYGEELWITHAVAPIEHKESFIRANEAFWLGMDGPD